MLARRTTSTPTAWTYIVVSADLGLHQDGALFGDNSSRLDNASGDGVLGFTTDRVNSYQRRSSPRILPQDIHLFLIATIFACERNDYTKMGFRRCL